jgi:hypothetical protein
MEELLWPRSTARGEASRDANDRSNAAATTSATSLPAALSSMFLHADKKMKDRFGNRIVPASISLFFPPISNHSIPRKYAIFKAAGEET